MADLLFRFRILDVILSLKYRRKAIVLMYHRILIETELKKELHQPGLFVRRETFQAQMEYLKNKFNVLSLREFTDTIINRGAFAKRSVLVTFDDGWKDNFTNAFPVLKSLCMPAVIFLTAGYIGSNRSFWQTRLTTLLNTLYQRIDAEKLVNNNLSELGEIQDLLPLLSEIDEEKRENIISNFLSTLKAYKIAEIDQIIEKLCTTLNIPTDTLGGGKDFLNWEEVCLMQKDDLAFGSHGVTHEILTINRHTALDETNQSKRIIEDHTDAPVTSFSYPNGNYDSAIADMVNKAGYDIAFSTRKGAVAPQNHRLAVPRVSIHEDMTGTIPMFLCRILGFW